MLPPRVRPGALVAEDGRHVPDRRAAITARFIAKTTGRKTGLFRVHLVFGAATLIFLPAPARTKLIAADFCGPRRRYRIHESLEVGNILRFVRLDPGNTLPVARSTRRRNGACAPFSFNSYDHRALFRSEFCHEIRSSNSRQQHFQVLPPQIPNQSLTRPHDGIGEVALGVLQLEHFFLHRAASDEAVGEDLVRLSDAVGAVDGPVSYT